VYVCMKYIATSTSWTMEWLGNLLAVHRVHQSNSNRGTVYKSSPCVLEHGRTPPFWLLCVPRLCPVAFYWSGRQRQPETREDQPSSSHPPGGLSFSRLIALPCLPRGVCHLCDNQTIKFEVLSSRTRLTIHTLLDVQD
jgi:hypothetical protein